MRNDKERMEFVNNSDNWEEIGMVGFVDNPLVRLSRLEYKGREWFKTEVWQMHFDHYDGEKRKAIYTKRWGDAKLYRFSQGKHAFDYSISAGTIKDEIKDIDREEKKKK